MTDAVFPYLPLDSSQRQFRLVRVLGLLGNLPTCELRVASLASNSCIWRALSYRWGDDEATKCILLDDEPFPVRPALYDFLKRLAQDGDHEWIFVDAICVDQSDDDERAAQVRLMGDIYKAAQKVIVWIPAKRGADVPVVKPKLMGRRVNAAGIYSATDVKNALKQSITEDAFWSRLWILQEIVLADQLEIRIGKTIFDASVLLDEIEPEASAGPFSDPEASMASFDAVIVEWARCSEDRGLQELMCKVSAARILQWRIDASTSIRSGELVPFHRVVALFNHLHCRLIHDKVFGVLGIANTRIVPDYTMPLVDLFIDILADTILSLDSWSADYEAGILDAREIIVLRTFDVRSTHALVALILYEVHTYFVLDAIRDLDTRLLLRECIWDRIDPGQSGSMEPDRKWYEPRYCANLRFGRDVITRSEDLHQRVLEAKLQNQTIESPWKINDTPDARSYEDWKQLVHTRCEAIWQRWEEQQNLTSAAGIRPAKESTPVSEELTGESIVEKIKGHFKQLSRDRQVFKSHHARKNYLLGPPPAR